MADIQIKIITDPQDALLQQVENLFVKMYEAMSEQGLMLFLTENGSSLWLESVKKLMNRMGIIVLAINEEKVVGFAQGSLKFAPDYLGSLKVGFINHLFVLPEFRRDGTGKEMAEILLNWFGKKEVHSMELQVLSLNTGGIEFWKELHFKEELIQMRRNCE